MTDQASIEVRYSTAVKGLQTIAGGDGDAADIAVHTLDMLRLLTEQPEKPEAVATKQPDARFRDEWSLFARKPEAVETGEPVAWPKAIRWRGARGDTRAEMEADYRASDLYSTSDHGDGRLIWVNYDDLVALAASTVSDGEARRKALESEVDAILDKVEHLKNVASDANKEASRQRDHEKRIVCAAVRDAMVGMELFIHELIDARALAAIPTAGDAK